MAYTIGQQASSIDSEPMITQIQYHPHFRPKSIVFLANQNNIIPANPQQLSMTRLKVKRPKTKKIDLNYYNNHFFIHFPYQIGILTLQMRAYEELKEYIVII